MNLTPRENCTVEGGYQLNKIATWGVIPLSATLYSHSRLQWLSHI